MEDAPRTTDRWLPILAFVLIAEAAAGFTSFVATVGPRDVAPPTAYYVAAAGAAILGMVTLIGGSQKNNVALDKSLVICALTALVLLNIVNAFLLFAPFRSQVRGYLLVLQPPSMLLMGLGAPLLWGAAIGRRDFPEDERLARIGRIGAGIAQVGFLFAFLYEAPGIFSIPRTMSVSSKGWYPVYSLLRLGSRVLLLWASIEMMRGGTEADVLRLRAGKVHRLMIGWIALLAATAAAGCIMSYTRSNQNSIPLLWRSLVSITMALIAAFAAAKWLRSRIAPGAAPA